VRRDSFASDRTGDAEYVRELRAARQGDIESGRYNARIRFLRERLAPWWEEWGALINPELAVEQARAVRLQADWLEEERTLL
jgi:hypothetical protein